MAGAPIVSIELLLDDAAAARVQAEWQALAAAGLPSMARHNGASNRPHITLLVRSAVPSFDSSALVDRDAFPVTLGAPLLFGTGDRRILVRSVVPSEALLGLHRAVHAAAGTGDDLPHTAPDGWTPHVTLSRRLPSADVPAALASVGGDIRGRAVALRRWDAATAAVTELGRFRRP